MHIIAVDDRKLALFGLEQAIRAAEPVCSVYCFSSAMDALSHAQNNPVDVAFLDIEMGAMDGLSLAKKLKDINGNTNIIFATAHPSMLKTLLPCASAGIYANRLPPKI